MSEHKAGPKLRPATRERTDTMKMKRWTRRLAWLLAAVLMISCLPMAAFAAGSTSVAKAQLGTDKNYNGTKVDLSKALYTFDLVEGRIYKIHNDTTAGKTVYPTGTTNGVTHDTAETRIEVTPATVGNTSYFRLNANPTGNNHIVFVGETWTNARDNIKLMFNRANSLNLYTEENKTTYVPCMEFALYEQSTDDANSEIPGYALATEITNGGKYLIAQKSGDTWYVMYPHDGDTGYNHVAKVVIETTTTEPDPVEPTDPPEQPTRPEGKPTIDVNNDLYQVVVMCEEKDNKGNDADKHYWSYPKKNGWSTTAAQFTVGDVRENDLDNDTAAQYPYICPVTPAYTLEQCLANINGESAGHRLVTTEATIPVAYYYWNATDGWQLLRDKQPDENVTFNQNSQWHEGTLTVYVTCAEEPEQPDPDDTDKPTTKPAVGNSTLYQVELLCEKHVASDPDCTNHWWSLYENPAAFTVGDIQANNTGYEEETYRWACPVTPAQNLDYYLTQLNNKADGHKMVSTALPTAWFFWNGESWILPNAEVNSGVRFNNNVGSLTLYATCAEEPEQPDPPTPPDPEQPDKPAAPANQPEEGTYTMPNDTLSGTGSSEPMSDADVNSYFRIPALVTLPNGWLVAASDARWPNTTDSPNNLDTIVSVSKDGGKTWDWEIVNYFADFAPLQGPTYYGNSTSGSAWASKTASASFIDPALIVDGSGKLWMLVDMLPSYGGNERGNKIVASTGFDDQGRLLVSHGVAGGNASGNAADYTYCVDLNAQPTKTAQKDGKSIGVYPICARSGGAETGYYVDAFMDLWYDYEDGGMKPVLCRQTDSNHYVQNNIFYQQSEWKVICTFYIRARSAEVDEDSGRLVWSEPKLLNVKNPGERFTAVCPGRGTTTTVTANGKQTERLMFQLYDNATGTERASTVYSDDGGVTWTRGARTEQLGETGKSSESQIVHLPDGTLRMYSRNDKSSISYADSTDNGATWGASRFDTDLPYCSNNMVSFIDVNGVLVSPDNQTVYENLILASYARTSYRSEGVIRIGSVDPDTNVVTWLNDDTIRFPNRYNYSCLTQLPNCAGFAVLYEQDDTSNPAKGVMAMRFATFTAADLLGEGWLLTAEKPTAAVTLTVDTGLIDLNFGGKRTVEVEYTPEDAQVSWLSSDESVVSVADGVITAVGAGKATVTVSVTKGALTRSATIPVLVQPESGELVLPEEYTDSVTTVVTPGTSGYRLTETETLADGNYVIYAERNGVESRVMHNSGTRTDHYRVTVDGKTMTGVTPANHEWTFTKSGEGYTIRSAGNKYLSTTESTEKAGQLALKDESTVFSVAYQGDGVWHIKNGDIYLGFNGGWKMQSGADTLKLFSAYSTSDTTTYTVSTDGLKALIQAAEMNEADYADVLAQGGEYDDEAAAQEALAQIDAAARELYEQLRAGNVTPYLVTYTVQDELLAVQSYYPGETIVPMTDPVRAGYVFTGWTGMPADKIMPERDLDLVAAFRAITTTGGSTGGGSSSGGSSSGGSSSGGGSSRPTSDKPADEDLKDPDVPLTDTPIVFVDVVRDAWYAKAVAAVAAQGLVKGVGENKFDPTASMTRSSLAEILYRLAGSEEQTAAAFADVAENAWYSNAVAWAAKNGVVTGVSDDTFDPERVITRQELAAMLVRYAKLVGMDTTADAKALDKFADGENTGSWAVDGMAWCVSKGILEGKNEDTLDPTADISRAEVAVMLDRFVALLK